jgi:alpha-N-arabinofuranosidase
MQDALAFGGAVISLLNHADRVRAACLAQLVNVIAPIMTETGGPAWRQTIFHPFAQMSHFGHGDVLRTRVVSETYEATYMDPRGAAENPMRMPAVPYLKTAAVRTPEGLNLFLLNRDLTGEMALEMHASGFEPLFVHEAVTLHDDDLMAANTRARPERVKPVPLHGVKVKDGTLHATLPPASWSVIRLLETR